MKIIVDEKETEVVGGIEHKNDIVRHVNRLRETGAKSMLFEVTAEEAASVGELPRGKDFRVQVAGEKASKVVDPKPAA
jgi:hypothetical protein